MSPDSSDSSEVIAHSPADVAYLRINAHTELRTTRTVPLSLKRPALMDDKFHSIYERVKTFVLDSSPGINQPSMAAPLTGDPELIRIGESIYATDTITSVASSSIVEDIRNCLEILAGTSCRFNQANPVKGLLADNDLTPNHIISVGLILCDMCDFTVVNSVYSRFFTFPLPPSRVTTSTKMAERVRLSAIISTEPRTGLHVQSRSYWAPANIGPYSQSVSVSHSGHTTNFSTTTIHSLPVRLGWSLISWSLRMVNPSQWNQFFLYNIFFVSRRPST